MDELDSIFGSEAEQKEGQSSGQDLTEAEKSLAAKKSAAKAKKPVSRRPSGVVIRKRTVQMAGGEISEMPESDQPKWTTSEAKEGSGVTEGSV